MYFRIYASTITLYKRNYRNMTGFESIPVIFLITDRLEALNIYVNVTVKEPVLSLRIVSQTPNVNGPPGAVKVNL